MDYLTHLVYHHGFALRPNLLDAGYTDQQLGSGVRHGYLHRIRPGAYTLTSYWRGLTPEKQHLLTAHAVVAQTPGTVALSHQTAMLAHGASLWGAPLDQVHVTRLDGGSPRKEAGVVHHVSTLDDSDLVHVGEHIVVTPARAAIEAASLVGVEAGLVGADSVLNLKLATPDELWQTYDSLSRWPQMRHVNLVVRLADPGAQSVGESRSRFLCYRFHLPRPELQYPVYDGDVLVGISDMVWHGCRLLGEFDGRVKYGRLLKPGESASDVVFQEKRREDRMREITSYGMFRFVWHDVDQEPARAAERLRRALFGRAA
mgnify:CR=1 FL=1